MYWGYDAAGREAQQLHSCASSRAVASGMSALIDTGRKDLRPDRRKAPRVSHAASRGTSAPPPNPIDTAGVTITGFSATAAVERAGPASQRQVVWKILLVTT